MAKANGVITVKVVLDTAEAEAKIAELQARGAELQEQANKLQKKTGGFAVGGQVSGASFDPRTWSLPKPKTVFPLPHISGAAVEIAGRLDGLRLSPEDAEYLIACIRSRTY